MNYVQLKKGKFRWYYIIKSPNGRTLAVSQKYFSRYNAKRAAKALLKDFNNV